MKAKSETWTDSAAEWAHYLGHALVRWLVLIIACYPLPHEEGLDGWIKESAVVFALFIGTALIVGIVYSH